MAIGDKYPDQEANQSAQQDNGGQKSNPVKQEGISDIFFFETSKERIDDIKTRLENLSKTLDKYIEKTDQEEAPYRSFPEPLTAVQQERLTLLNQLEGIEHFLISLQSSLKL